MNKSAALMLTLLMPLLLELTAGRAMAAEISVALESPPASGTVVLALFSSANTFGDLRDPDRLEAYTLDGRESYVLTDIPPGEYALMAYYDENDNLKIDKSFIGIPTEPLGFSNNYTPKGPPSYTRAAFSLAYDERREFTVDLQRPLGKLGRLGLGRYQQHG